MSKKEKKDGLTEQEEKTLPADQEPEIEVKPAEEQPDYYEK